MLINKTTGEINIGTSLLLGPDLTLDVFRSAADYSRWQALDSERLADYAAYKIGTTAENGCKLTVWIRFYEQKLCRVRLHIHIPDDPKNSEAFERCPNRLIIQQDFHHEILNIELGETTDWQQTWGYVTVESDATYTSAIGINYRLCMKHDPSLKAKFSIDFFVRGSNNPEE
jgi:hypothetical protein